MAKRILKYGVMFGSFSPILKKDFDIAKRVMDTKKLDGIVFVPDSVDTSIYDVQQEDKVSLIKIAAQDYVNAIKEDVAFMVSPCRLYSRNRTVKDAIAALAKEVEETNKYHPEFYIEHCFILHEDAVVNEHSYDGYEVIKYTFDRDYKKDSVLNLHDIPNNHIRFYEVQDMLRHKQSLPKDIFTGANHANYYLNQCLDLH